MNLLPHIPGHLFTHSSLEGGLFQSWYFSKASSSAWGTDSCKATVWLTVLNTLLSGTQTYDLAWVSKPDHFSPNTTPHSVNHHHLVPPYYSKLSVIPFCPSLIPSLVFSPYSSLRELWKTSCHSPSQNSPVDFRIKYTSLATAYETQMSLAQPGVPTSFPASITLFSVL